MRGAIVSGFRPIYFGNFINLSFTYYLYQLLYFVVDYDQNGQAADSEDSSDSKDLRYLFSCYSGTLRY